MKDYQQVIRERYDLESWDAKSIYDADQPIGKYVRSRMYPALSGMLCKFAPGSKPFGQLKLLDVGCGTGGMIAFMLSAGFHPKNTLGIDLSASRISIASARYPDVRFRCDNGLHFQTNETYDVITSFDMFSHIVNAEDIVEGLRNLAAHLNEDGIFLWYDIYSRDHFDAPDNIHSWGFSARQMKELAAKAGLVAAGEKKLFRLFFGKYHSVYRAARIPFPLLRFMERIIPGTPGNLMMVFKKQ